MRGKGEKRHERPGLLDRSVPSFPDPGAWPVVGWCHRDALSPLRNGLVSRMAVLGSSSSQVSDLARN